MANLHELLRISSRQLSFFSDDLELNYVYDVMNLIAGPLLFQEDSFMYI